MDVLNLDAIVCVFDQLIYSMASKIKWKEPLKFEWCLLLTGIFGLHMVFMSILKNRFGNVGLGDALVQSSIVADGSVDSVLHRKSYNRSIRLYKLYYEALNWFLFKQLEGEAPEMYKEYSRHAYQIEVSNCFSTAIWTLELNWVLLTSVYKDFGLVI